MNASRNSFDDAFTVFLASPLIVIRLFIASPPPGAYAIVQKNLEQIWEPEDASERKEILKEATIYL
jgi:hypothetical protein